MTTEVAPAQCAAYALLRSQLRYAHHHTLRALDRSHPGMAKVAARLVVCEDLTVSGFVLARQPLAFSSWYGRTGLSELPRLGAPIDWQAWATRVRVNVGWLRGYAQAVYSATDATLDTPLSDWSVCALNALLLTMVTHVIDPTDEARRGSRALTLVRGTDPG